MTTIASKAALVLGAVLVVGLAGPVAQAYDGTPSGVSVGAGVDVLHDGTITDAYGNNIQGPPGELSLAVLGNVGDLALGGVVAGSPSILDSDGRLLVGVRVGVQPTFGTTRCRCSGSWGTTAIATSTRGSSRRPRPTRSAPRISGPLSGSPAVW
jgi:hypothetical protein